MFAGKLVVEHGQPLADSESLNRETAYCDIRRECCIVISLPGLNWTEMD